jgi:hypothetical protein
MSFGVIKRVSQKYSENYFGAGIIAVEKSCAGPTTTVRFSCILDICGALAASSTVLVLAVYNQQKNGNCFGHFSSMSLAKEHFARKD